MVAGERMIFWKKKEKKEEGQAEANRNFLEFLKAARGEMEGLMARDADWFRNLPYRGAMSIEEARNFEIEKRAIWRRVIYDAKRTRLPGLRWETRGDDRVCPDCQKMEGRIFSLEEYDTLNQESMHPGCRCNLVSVRE
jgi:SPP1 gp7 family putative phage head morphogenesis protein